MPDVFVKPNKKPATPKNGHSKEKSKPSPQTTITETAKETAYEDLHTNSLTMLTTFCKNPKNVQLVGQNASEEILLFIRQDFITNLPWIFYTILFGFLPAFAPFLLSMANIPLDFLPLRFNILLVSFYYLLIAGYALANFLTWFYTIGVVTNQKAVDIDFHNLSSIHVGSVSLADTSNAKYKQAGFLQSFFDYGDIIITIEATQENFLFERTPRPAQIADLLSDLIGEK